MKAFGAILMLVAAVSLMGGIIAAQRDYQRSWSESTAQMSAANPAATATSNRVRVASN